MNTYYMFILFASILLFSNSSLAYRIYSSPYEQYHEDVPVSKMLMVAPAKGDSTWSQHVLPPSYEVPDQRGRRGWGSGRRRSV